VIVAVTGSSGLLGSALIASLIADGHGVIRLIRRDPRPGERALRWDPSTGAIMPSGPALADAVVHLAGESVADGRWTAAHKQRIRDSRVGATRRLVETLTRMATPPAVLVSASATGYYGHRGDEILTEESRSGTGYLAEVSREWEAATAVAIARGVRVVTLRIGIVLSPVGGALAKMLFPFRLGLGGALGDGRQWMSWISLEDTIAVIRHALDADALRGPINTVAPSPVTNAEFARTLAHVLWRPAVIPMPAFALRLALGEMADELLLSSIRAVPARLQAEGFTFRHLMLESALRSALGTS
jgi:uncharacterized protein (TIGR01777 family)